MQSVLKNSSIHSTSYSDLKHSDIIAGLFVKDNQYYLQLTVKRNENDEFDYYELIIADKSDSSKKKMAVLTADGLESELIQPFSYSHHQSYQL